MQLSRLLILEVILSARRAKTFWHNSAEIPVAIDSRYREEATEREDAFFGWRQRAAETPVFCCATLTRMQMDRAD
jgi:hypothetical protein